jgi:hypothetical protein
MKQERMKHRWTRRYDRLISHVSRECACLLCRLKRHRASFFRNFSFRGFQVSSGYIDSGLHTPRESQNSEGALLVKILETRNARKEPVNRHVVVFQYGVSGSPPQHPANQPEPISPWQRHQTAPRRRRFILWTQSCEYQVTQRSKATYH